MHSICFGVYNLSALLYANVASLYRRKSFVWHISDWQFAFAASRREKREQKYSKRKFNARRSLELYRILSQIIDTRSFVEQWANCRESLWKLRGKNRSWITFESILCVRSVWNGWNEIRWEQLKLVPCKARIFRIEYTRRKIESSRVVHRESMRS